MLEERLLTTQARVRFWRELRERHASVSAIACEIQSDHAKAMASRGVLPPEPAKKARTVKARRVASASNPGRPVRPTPASTQR